MRARPGFALPAVIAVTIVLAGLAALANASALAALRESRALLESAQTAATHDALQARAAVLLRTRRNIDVVGLRQSLGGGDTSLAVSEIAWPWHRVVVTGAGAPIVAEFARVKPPSVMWCVAAVYGVHASIVTGTVFAAPPSGCVDALHVPSIMVAALDSAIGVDLVVPPAPDSLVVTSSVDGVVRARAFVDIRGPATVNGLIIAPTVRVGAGANVRGLIAARDTVVVTAGAVVLGDELVVANTLRELAIVRPLGRRGLHLRP